MEQLKIQKLQDELNQEYENIGVIIISEASEVEIAIKDIKFVDEIMDKVDPLDLDKPIVVAKSYYSDRLNLIDGYHRLKASIKKGDTTIKAIVLKKYSLNRNNDNLFKFISDCIGQEICFLGDNVFSLNGKLHYIKENEGCPGCGNGWSSFDLHTDNLNKEYKIKTVQSVYEDGDEDNDVYDLYINGTLIATVDTGWGNGYYGGDFAIII